MRYVLQIKFPKWNITGKHEICIRTENDLFVRIGNYYFSGTIPKDILGYANEMGIWYNKSITGMHLFHSGNPKLLARLSYHWNSGSLFDVHSLEQISISKLRTVMKNSKWDSEYTNLVSKNQWEKLKSFIKQLEHGL